MTSTNDTEQRRLREGCIDLPTKVQSDVSDARTFASLAMPTLAEQIVDLLRTVRGHAEMKTALVRRAGRNEQMLIDFFVGQRGVRQRRTTRPHFPEGHGKRVNIRMQRRMILKIEFTLQQQRRGGITNHQGFSGHPAQWKELPVKVRPILVLVLNERHGAIGQFNGEIRIEQAVSRRDIAVNEIEMRQILKSTGQLIGEINVRSRAKRKRCRRSTFPVVRLLLKGDFHRC